MQILKELSEAGRGYDIVPHLYKFEEYGVPQMRHRIIIVGIRKDLDLRFKVPAPTTPDKYVTAKEAITNPPIPDDAPNHEFTRHNAKTVEMLKHIPPGENAWYEGIPEELRLNVKKARLSQIYRRLHPDQPPTPLQGAAAVERTYITGRSRGLSQTGKGRGSRHSRMILCLRGQRKMSGSKSAWQFLRKEQRSSLKPF
ncbi:Modification methylase BspRI [Geobacillus sp. BCO2]|nr:Modification methylase BspRI [Geobacillus sp. BCO2]